MNYIFLKLPMKTYKVLKRLFYIGGVLVPKTFEIKFSLKLAISFNKTLLFPPQCC